MNNPIKILHDNFEAHIDPTLGGALLSFREKGPQGWVDWLRPAPKDCTDVLQTACYPLVPFSNRIALGHFNWRGKNVSLPANFPPEPHAIHGHGWQSAWTVSEQASDRVSMGMRHDEGDWPWAYEARQDIRLDGGALSITLSLVNQSPEPMPAGLGLHPFFPRTNKTRMKAKVGAIQLNGEDGLPTKTQAQHPAIQSFHDGSMLIGGLDNAFENWDGSAQMDWPEGERSLTMIASENLRHLVIFTPEGADFFCVEPVSHMNGAFGLNSPEAAKHAGLTYLGPGEEALVNVTFRPAGLLRR